MATAVVQVNLENLPSDLAVADSYTRAFVVVWRQRHVVAYFDLPVARGRVDMARFGSLLFRQIGWRVRYWAAEEYLGPIPQPPLTAATVAICTRERPDDLRRTLDAVTLLRPAAREILVIDNRPRTERTQAVVAGVPQARYIREDRPGLDAARNRALRDAQCDIVAFTDDDATPDPEWLGGLLTPFDDPRVMCATGLTLPLELETPAQEWFQRYSPFGRGCDRLVFDGTRDDVFAIARAGVGANMALRRAALDELGGFDEDLDAGTPACSGGDHEMFARILAAGHRIVYEPSAVSWHRHRRTWPELREVLRGYGVGVYAMWTRKLCVEGEPGVLRHAFGWLRHGQLPGLWRSLRTVRGAAPLDLIAEELRGCLAGPGAYFRSRRRRRGAERTAAL